MIKKLIAFHCSFLIFNFSFSQTWEPVGGGLKAPIGSIEGVSSLCTYGDKLYAGGSFKQAGNLQVNYIACWDGQKWDSLKNGTNGHVDALFVFHNQLCVGGPFTQAGKKRVDFLARWIDTTNAEPDWYNLGSTFVALKDLRSPTYTNTSIGAFAEYHNQLYVAGAFGYGGCAINHVGVLNNGKWTVLNSPKYSVSGDTIKDAAYVTGWSLGMGLAVYNNKLYATGVPMVDNLDSSNRPEKTEDITSWDDKKSIVSFLPFKNTIYSPFNTTCLAVYNSQLYVGGLFAMVDNKPAHSIAFWNADHWTALPSGVNGEVFAMLVYNGKLYVGGRFDSAGGKPAKGIAAWDGHTWSAVGKGFTDHNLKGFVAALAIYKGELYAAGYFNASGMQPLNNIARLKLSGTMPTPTQPKKNKNG